jgi:hypothetical protein
MIQVVLFLITVTLVTLVYPWSLRTPTCRIWVHLPLSLLVLYFTYEATMPPDMNIRVDLFLLWPLLGLAGLCYAVKLLLLSAQPPLKPTDPCPASVSMGAAGPSSFAEMDEANKKLAPLLPNTKSCQRDPAK